jgi:Uma2 family endonuclease
MVKTMVQTPIKPLTPPTSPPPTSLTLEDFLALPETKPASEFIDGQIYQKAMPKGKHSALQGELVPVINAAVRPTKVAWAFPELRCSFGGRSIVPDVCVFKQERIPRDEDGDIANTFERAPDWTIEILSPGQSPTKVINNILHCLDHDCEMGWMLNPEDKEITVFPAESRSRVFTLDSIDMIPVPGFAAALALTSAEIFGWLGNG